MKEVHIVMQYIQKLNNHTFKGRRINATDIGVTSPYKLQCDKIEERCKYLKLEDVTIGTAEKFQGNEKPIIIVSTVRSNEEFLGDFMQNKQVCGTMLHFCIVICLSDF